MYRPVVVSEGHFDQSETMYYAYKKIKEHREKKRAQAVEEASAALPSGGDIEGDPLGGNDPVAVEEKKEEDWLSPSASVPADNDPLLTGIPNSAENRKSKRYSWYALLLSGFALAIDFTAAMMSIQTFYYALNGPKRLYGLTFGSYDLTALLAAPCLGFVCDRYSIYKVLLLICFLFNGAGNLIYAFSYLGDAWYMMLIARCVAGIGAAALSLGSTYIAQTTTMEQRQTRLVSYRVSQTLARMFGPWIGYFFLGLPSVNSSSSTALKVFNWYTIPGWVAVCIIVLVIGIVAFLFVDPSNENEHYVRENHSTKDESVEEKKSEAERKKTFQYFVGMWLFIAFASVFLQFGYYSNLFALFAGQYHDITDQVGQWKVFIGIGAGAVFGSVLYRTGVKAMPRIFDERIVVIVSSWLMMVVYLLVIPYGGATSVPPAGTFYASTAIFGIAVVLFFPSLEAFFSKKITQYQDVVGENIGKLLGVYYMAVSGGRFAGPLVIGAVTFIATPSGQVGYCANGESVGSDGSPICDGDTSTSCAIFPDVYYVEGCVLKHAIPVYSVFAGVSGLLAILIMVIVKRHWNYKK